MLCLTQFCAFGVSNPADLVPDPFSLSDLNDAGFVASARTNIITLTGISSPITLRLQVTSPMSTARVLTIFVDGSEVVLATSGTQADFAIANGQTLQIEMSNAQDVSTWSGTAALSNLSSANTLLASFAFSLQDTGSGGGGGGGGGGEPP